MLGSENIDRVDYLGSENIDQVDYLSYLGNILGKDGGHCENVRSKIAGVQAVFSYLKKI